MTLHPIPEHFEQEGEQAKPDAPLAHVLLAGGIGGVVGDSLMYPLDTIKTRQQGAAHMAKYHNMASATRTILREEGFRYGVCRGYVAALLGSFPSTMLFFGTYEYSKRVMKTNLGVHDSAIHFVSGLLGDLCASVVYVPSEVVKARLQLQGPHNNRFFTSGYNYTGVTNAVKTICRVEGPRALFYGYQATLIRDLPFSALQFAFYEEFRVWATQHTSSKDIGLGLELATGGAAGGLAGIITTPLDVVKTRVQTQTDNKVKGTWQGLKDILRSEGPTRLFSGVGPRFVWTSIQSSVMLVFYQYVLRLLEAKGEPLIERCI